MSNKPDISPPRFEVEAGCLLVHPDSVGQDVSLTRWFALFAVWLAVAIILLRFDPLGLGSGPAGFRLRVLLCLALYLSAACTFLPLPIHPLIAWAATATLGLDKLDKLPGFVRKFIAAMLGAHPQGVGLADEVWQRVLLIAAVGALASTVGILNDYYLLTGLLRSRKVASVRNTRLYRAAIRWFSRAAWLTVFVFAVLPIPVDVVRLLAITFRYPRWRLASASYAGRFIRYTILAVLVAAFDNRPAEQWLIVLLVTGLTVLGGLTFGLSRLIRFFRGEHPPANAATIEAKEYS